MQSADDSVLLRQFAENHSDEAFAALVARHINLVYSVALRCVGDPHLAEEVAQAVFILLAKKAAQLRHDKALSSWLFQTTRLTASNFVRGETRRYRREQEAHMQSVLNDSGIDVWPRIAPLLDDAVAGLSEKDRHAIVLRFYEGRNLREVGAALGASEDAAEKRVSRAVERLREFFAKRGVTVGASGLVVVISTNAVQAAPIGLAVTISTAAALAGTTFVAAATATNAIAMTTLQKTLFAAVIAAASVSTTLMVQHQADQKSRIENAAWRAKTNQLADMEALHAENQRLAKLQNDADELARLRKDQSELLRLRGEVGLLRQHVAQAIQREEQRSQDAVKTRAAAAQKQAEIPSQGIRFISADAIHLVSFYAELSGLELDLHPTAANSPAKITLENDRAMTRSEAMSLVEKTLREQAGLVVKQSAPGRATVFLDTSVMTKP